MSISPEAVRFDEDVMWAEPSDGRTIGTALSRFPRRPPATAAEREARWLGRHGLHGEALDEDVPVAGLLAGQGDRTGRGTWVA